jgi:hypothetical protein
MQNASNKPVRITIKVTREGDFTIDPSVKRVHPKQEVEWTSSQGPFTIAFQEGTPFKNLDFNAVKVKNGWSVNAGAVVVPCGMFHYTMAIYVAPIVLMNAGCPEIIVSRR